MPSPLSPGLALERTSATTVRTRGRELVAFAGCDYLGLAHHPEVIAAVREETGRHGLSAGASPTTTGRSPAHEQLEQELARFLDVEGALLVADGYLSNLVAAQALGRSAGARWSITSAMSACATRCRPRSWRSRSMRSSRACAPRSRAVPRGRRRCSTDGVFPAQRRLARVRELAQLLEQGARALVVDDCHGLGVLGPGGRGACAAQGVAHERLLITGTLSKALGGFGGFVAGRRAWLEAAIRGSRAFAGATPIPPALACAGSAALRILVREPARVERLRAHGAWLRARLAPLGFALPDFDVPVLALARATPEATQALHERLLARGLLVPHVHYPDGLGGYLRLALCSEHRAEDLERLASELTRACSA
jgi:8-amino-7-oxononanoate synthase